MAALLDAAVRQDLRGLQKETADVVARHLVAAGRLVDDEPERALAHARFARRRASRIAVVREAAGIAAYHAGEWAEALAELRAARRMGGGPGHLAVMADIERALGRPERALDLAQAPEARELGVAEAVELAIVAAGARRDLGEIDAAVVGLQSRHLDPTLRESWSARLFYAYADNLLAAGRDPEALTWFVHAAEADADGDTDADARIAELSGDAPDGDDDLIVFGIEGLDDGAPADAAAEVSAPREEAGARMSVAALPERVTGATEERGTGATEAPFRDGVAPPAAIDGDGGADRDTGAAPDGGPIEGGADLAADAAPVVGDPVPVGDRETGPVGSRDTAPVVDDAVPVGDHETGPVGDGDPGPVGDGDTGPVGDGDPGPGAGGARDGDAGGGDADETRADGASAGGGAEEDSGGSGTDGPGGSAPGPEDGGGDPGAR